MTKALQGLCVEVEIRPGYEDKLGHGFGVHLSMFLSHYYLIPSITRSNEGDLHNFSLQKDTYIKLYLKMHLESD